jgi:hypothetical protein
MPVLYGDITIDNDWVAFVQMGDGLVDMGFNKQIALRDGSLGFGMEVYIASAFACMAARTKVWQFGFESLL